MVKIFGVEFGRKVVDEHPPSMSVNDLPNYNAYSGFSPAQDSIYDGEKFTGGFGTTQLFEIDYWTLRARSSQVFQENLYAAGIIKRLVTNEINTGLTPEATPDSSILGISEDELQDWSENVENRFSIWHKNPELCDFYGASTFGSLQRQARMESLISGDVLVVLRQSYKTKLPQIQLIRGDQVRTPLLGEENLKDGHTIRHGVEQDKNGKIVAYWVTEDASTWLSQADWHSKRVPAFGKRTGRKLSWLVYGTQKRLNHLRGQPLLSLVLQSLKEIDRYRDSTQRKAVINSILAMVVTKTQDKPGTLPISGGATRKSSGTVTDTSGEQRTLNLQSHVPGMVVERLDSGEDIKLKGGEGTDINFRSFEEAVINAIAWANEIPPEILILAFTNNYSASQAAINEFKIYLNKIWSEWGETFCSPIYVEWLLAEVLLQKTSAKGLLESWRNPQKYDIYGAWISTEWYGSIKPSTDMLKQAKGSKLLVDSCWSTNAREARGLTGSKFTKNAVRIRRENELKVAAMTPLAEFAKKFGEEIARKAEKTVDAIAINS